MCEKNVSSSFEKKYVTHSNYFTIYKMIFLELKKQYFTRSLDFWWKNPLPILSICHGLKNFFPYLGIYYVLVYVENTNIVNYIKLNCWSSQGGMPLWCTLVHGRQNREGVSRKHEHLHSSAVQKWFFLKSYVLLCLEEINLLTGAGYRAKDFISPTPLWKAFWRQWIWE